MIIAKDLDADCHQMVILIYGDMHAPFIRRELGEVPWARDISLLQIVTFKCRFQINLIDKKEEESFPFCGSI